MNNKIFTICMASELQPKINLQGDTYNIRDFRTIGYYFSMDKAKETLLAKGSNVNEAGYFPYCIIEEFGPGIYNTHLGFKQWYRWCDTNKVFQETTTPKDLAQTVNFGIG